MKKTDNTGWLPVIAISLLNPVALLVAPFVWLAMHGLSKRAAEVDCISGLTRWEHAHYNPGIPFRKR